MFVKSKSELTAAAEIYLTLIKITNDDANFAAWLKQQLTYNLNKAETCKKNLSSQLLSKNSAGYQANNLVQDSFKELTQDLKNDGKNGNKELMDQLRKAELRDQNAEQERKNLDNSIPNPPSNQINPKPEEAKKPDEIKPKSKIDPQIEETLKDSILDNDPNVHWDDIKGLADVKKILNETIVLPQMRPDIFSGLYAPSKGILLYGPPGTGKTLLAKAIATECKSTFFSISASTLTSKWMGEGEKLMRGLFQMAIEKAPSVIFFDEIDSIMGSRGGNEHEASRRLKTEFLVQFDGVNGNA